LNYDHSLSGTLIWENEIVQLLKENLAKINCKFRAMQPARRLCRAGGRPSFTLLSSAVCALLMSCLYFASLAQSETDSRRLSSEQNNPLKYANCKLMEHLSERGQTTPWPNRRKWKIEIGVKNTIVHATTSRPREWSARGGNRLGGCEGALCTCWLSTSDANSTILTRGM
jgi:hypothetical protein